MYKNMVKICWYNDFQAWFGLWDVVETYAMAKRDIKKFPEDLKFVIEEYKKILYAKEKHEY
jgi:hypothetical protein